MEQKVEDDGIENKMMGRRVFFHRVMLVYIKDPSWRGRNNKNPKVLSTDNSPYSLRKVGSAGFIADSQVVYPHSYSPVP